MIIHWEGRSECRDRVSAPPPLFLNNVSYGKARFPLLQSTARAPQTLVDGSLSLIERVQAFAGTFGMAAACSPERSRVALSGDGQRAGTVQIFYNSLSTDAHFIMRHLRIFAISGCGCTSRHTPQQRQKIALHAPSQDPLSIITYAPMLFRLATRFRGDRSRVGAI